MTRIGQEPDREANRGLEVCCTSFTKKATPGDSTVGEEKKEEVQTVFRERKYFKIL